LSRQRNGVTSLKLLPHLSPYVHVIETIRGLAMQGLIFDNQNPSDWLNHEQIKPKVLRLPIVQSTSMR
jgi:hypothetical protein